MTLLDKNQFTHERYRQLMRNQTILNLYQLWRAQTIEMKYIDNTKSEKK